MRHIEIIKAVYSILILLCNFNFNKNNNYYFRKILCDAQQIIQIYSG